MGMHEFEWCVEGSIRTLAASPRVRGLDLRSLFKALYDFEGRYDTGFTRFNVIEILLKHRFAYAFKLEEHPDHGRYGDRLLPRERDDVHVLRDPTKKWHKEKNPAVAYVLDPDRLGKAVVARLPGEMRGVHLVCEAGSEIWKRLVDSGRLRGPDAAAPLTLPIEEVALTVAREGEASSNRKLVRMWFMLLFIDLIQPDPEDFDHEEVAARIAIREFRAIAQRLAVRDYPAGEMDYGMLRWPTEEEIGDFPGRGARWWFDLVSV